MKSIPFSLLKKVYDILDFDSFHHEKNQNLGYQRSISGNLEKSKNLKEGNCILTCVTSIDTTHALDPACRKPSFMWCFDLSVLVALQYLKAVIIMGRPIHRNFYRKIKYVCCSWSIDQTNTQTVVFRVYLSMWKKKNLYA